MSKEQLIPNGDKILVKPVEADKVSGGGIILSAVSQEEKAEGIIIAVGTGKMTDEGRVRPMRFQVGQKVLYGKYAGDQVEVNGVPYRIIRDIEVLATVVQSGQ